MDTEPSLLLDSACRATVVARQRTVERTFNEKTIAAAAIVNRDSWISKAGGLTRCIDRAGYRLCGSLRGVRDLLKSKSTGFE